MQAKELRIGNWINIQGVPTQIESTHYKHGVNVWSETEYDMSVIEGEHDLKPIPLTPEILEKCGFDNPCPHFPSWVSFVIEIRKDIATLWPKEGYAEGYNIKAPCKYIHQLQNLYFALTGEEVQINL